MVEYLPVGPKGAPQTIFGEKIISGLKSLNFPNPQSYKEAQPSVHLNEEGGL